MTNIDKSRVKTVLQALRNLEERKESQKTNKRKEKEAWKEEDDDDEEKGQRIFWNIKFEKNIEILNE
jgi:hypothetical protein